MLTVGLRLRVSERRGGGQRDFECSEKLSAKGRWPKNALSCNAT